MAEMPFDVVNGHLHTFAEEGYFTQSSDINVPDPVDLAITIDQEIQRKFLFIPFEEIDEIDIEEKMNRLFAGSGTEGCTANPRDNPTWLYDHAVNALALWRHMVKEQERKTIEARPEPGWYIVDAGVNIPTYVSHKDRRIFTVANAAPGVTERTEAFDKGQLKHWTWHKMGTYVDEVATIIEGEK